LTSEIVSSWFGKSFSNLDYKLQVLHRNGGMLHGKVEVIEGKGLARLIGRRIASKLNIPRSGIHDLLVNISHDEHYLHWDRQFNETTFMKSTFRPVGTIENGYWIENSGPLELMLTVNVKNQGWYWRCLQYKYRGIPIPAWLFPKMNAYKCIEDGGYRFYVGCSLPFIGLLFSYSGILQAKGQGTSD